MSASTINPGQASAIAEWGGCFRSPEETCPISASRSVGADRARIFQAITVPEYMEAWLAVPGSIPGYTRVFGGDESFSVSGPTEDGSRFRISCAYRVFRRSKLVFTWKPESWPDPGASLVRIRLQGDFERTTVDVTHSGLTEIERRWCEELWDISLEKLSRLF